MKKKLLSIFLIGMFFLGSIVTPVFAQDYYFQVETENVNYYVNSDGTTTVSYSMVFVNGSSAHVIDFVDIGMPTMDYSLGNATADIDGHQITDITDSQYVKGITLGLGSYSIPPGGRGTVNMTLSGIHGGLFQASQKESVSYASFNFSPNYFESKYVFGSTNMTITLFLPVGVQPDQPRYITPQKWPGNAAPETGYDAEGRVFYRWQYTDASVSSEYIFGATFPMTLVPTESISTPPPPFDLASFFSSDMFCGCVCGLGFLVFFGLTIYAATVGAKKRKLQYLPPKISIEGHGIKRGLTPVESAILMETPMDKVLTMILFSVLKKGAATVVSRDPLKLEQTSPVPEGLYPYEEDFLKAFREPDDRTRKTGLQDTMINLVKSVGEKMKGFSRKETVDFYKQIMEKAWEQVNTANTPEVKGQVYEEVMDWTMLDHNFDTRTQQTFGNTVFVPAPSWWWRYEPSIRTGSIGGVGHAAAGGGITGPANISLPHLPGSDFAASVVHGVQNFSAGVIGDLTNFTGGVTNKTNPVPVSTYHGSGSGGGGGHSCACACACAGCACACAGGGR